MRSLLKNKSGFAAMVGGIVALLITTIIGVMIFYQISSSITMSSVTANTSKNTTLSMANTVFNLFPIIALVSCAGVILGVILGFGNAGRQS